MQLCIRGHGIYLGMDCQWETRYRPADGAFLETIKSKQLSFQYAHPGCPSKGPLPQSWAVSLLLVPA